MSRPWRAAVLDSLQRLAARNRSSEITGQDIIRDELPRIVVETQTTGLTPDFTLSRELQLLRDAGLLEFLGRGRYRLLKPVVEAETFDGNDRELDAAIKEGRLRFGRVETGSKLALQKRRRGQQRLRSLALACYHARCALRDLDTRGFLVASHIALWAASEDGRGDLCNVIILCRPHDSLFEFGYWSLQDDLTILRSPQQRPPWVVTAILPPTISFRPPRSHAPVGDYLKVHRQLHGLD